MEPAQINEAQDEYESTLDDAQHVDAPTIYELAAKLDPDSFYADQGDYLMCESEGIALMLQTYINAALKAECDGDRAVYDIFARDIGKMVIENFEITLNELHAMGAL